MSDVLVQQQFRPCAYVRILGPVDVQNVQVGQVYPVHKWTGKIPIINIAGADESDPVLVECRVPGGTGLPYHPLWEPAPAPEKVEEKKVEKKVKKLTADDKFGLIFGTAFSLWLILMVGSVGSVLASGTWGIANNSTDSTRVKPQEDVELDEKIDKYLDGETSFRDIADDFPSLGRRMHPLLYSRATFVCDHHAVKTDDLGKVQEYKEQVTEAWITHYSSNIHLFKIIAQGWRALFIAFAILAFALMVTASAMSGSDL